LVAVISLAAIVVQPGGAFARGLWQAYYLLDLDGKLVRKLDLTSRDVFDPQKEIIYRLTGRKLQAVTFDGKEQWNVDVKFSAESVTFRMILTPKTVVIAGEDIRGFDRIDGKEVYRNAFPYSKALIRAWSPSSTSTGDDSISYYVLTQKQDTVQDEIDGHMELRAMGPAIVSMYDLATGKMVWQTQFPAASATDIPGQIFPGMLFTRNSIISFDVKTGRAVGAVSLAGKGKARSVLITEDAVYALKKDVPTTLVAYEVGTLRKKWSVDLPGYADYLCRAYDKDHILLAGRKSLAVFNTASRNVEPKIDVPSGDWHWIFGYWYEMVGHKAALSDILAVIAAGRRSANLYTLMVDLNGRIIAAEYSGLGHEAPTTQGAVAIPSFSIQAISPKDGKEIWRWKCPSNRGADSVSATAVPVKSGILVKGEWIIYD